MYSDFSHYGATANYNSFVIVCIETCWLDHSDSADPDQTAKGIILSRSILLVIPCY